MEEYNSQREQSHEASLSIMAAVQEINRSLFFAALKGAISADRRRDIATQADRIVGLSQYL